LAQRPDYVELSAKSNFSFLTGASKPEELVQAALQNDLYGLALTDFNGVYGLARV
jgi:DNA polymerase III alpha subunit